MARVTQLTVGLTRYLKDALPRHSRKKKINFFILFIFKHLLIFSMNLSKTKVMLNETAITSTVTVDGNVIENVDSVVRS